MNITANFLGTIKNVIKIIYVHEKPSYKIGGGHIMHRIWPRFPPLKSSLSDKRELK